MTEKKHRYNKDYKKSTTEEKKEEVIEKPVKEKKPKIVKKVVNTKSGGFLNVRKEPKVANNIIGKLYNGDVVTVVETVDQNWTKINTGYVMSKFLEDTK